VAAHPQSASREDARLTLWVVALVAALVAVLRLSDVPDLDAGDQKKTAQYLLHLWQGGSWALPLEQGSIFPTKPPLFVWLGALAAMVVGGPTDLALRLPSAVAGVLLAVMTAHMAMLLRNVGSGFVAGLAVITTPLFLKLVGFGRPDMVLCLCITASLWAWTALRAGRGSRPFLRVVFWGALGLGVLAKGPVGPAVVLGAIALTLLWTGAWRSRRCLRPARGALLFFAIVLAWFIPAVVEGGTEFLRIQVLDEVVQRTFDPEGRGARPHGAGSFLAETAGRFLPWTLFLPAAVAATWTDLRASRKRRDGDQRGPLLPAAWLLAALLVFLVPAQKRADYAMAFLPAAAILVGMAFASANEDRLWPRRLLLGACVALAAAGCIAFVRETMLKGSTLGKDEGISMDEGKTLFLRAAATVTVLGSAAAFLIHRGRAVAAAAVLATLVLAGVAAEQALLHGPRRAELRARREALVQLAEEGVSVVAYRSGDAPGNSGVLFYLGCAEPTLHTPEEVRTRAAAGPGGRVRLLTGERGAAELEGVGVAGRIPWTTPEGTDWIVLECPKP
jgi:4-amino-4-deoxy-L-arabinose transferase-like glycosyltransferase